MASYNTSGITSYTDTSSIAGISAASGQDYSSGSSGLMSAPPSRGRNRDADMYAGSKYAPTKNAGTAKAKQSFAATATSSDDDDNGYTPAALAPKFEAAGATLPPAKDPRERFRDTLASSLYDSDMFKPYVPDPTDEIESYLGRTAVEDALKEALGIDDTQRQTYQGIPTAEEPEPNIDMSVLQAALMPEPITVEELEVKAGDTLSAIAAENNLPVQDVIDANPQIKNPNLIRPGEKVKLPEAAGTMNFTGGYAVTANLQFVDIEDETGAAKDRKDKLINSVFKAEGGYSTDKDDTGNYYKGKFVGTNHGISAPALAKELGRTPTVADMKALTKEEAKKIAGDQYFDRFAIDKLPEEVQEMVLHATYMGETRGVRAMQNLLGLTPDGIMGPNTRLAMENANFTKEEYKDEYLRELQFGTPGYSKPAATWNKHGKGWTNRYTKLAK